MEVLRWIASADAFVVALFSVLLIVVVSAATLYRGIVAMQSGGDLAPYVREAMRPAPVLRVALVLVAIIGVANLARMAGAL